MYYVIYHKNQFLVVQFYNRLYSTMNSSVQKEYYQGQRVRPTQMIASFLLKTYEILQTKQYEHIVCWDSDHVGFIIKNVLQFSKQILPKYFRHNNFSSFVRQLNMYDFHKIKQTSDSMVFKNSYFKKDGYNLLKQIKRKAPKRTDIQRKISMEDGVKLVSQKKEKNKKQMKGLIESQIQNSSIIFQKSIKLLESQNQEITKTYNSIEMVNKPVQENILNINRVSVPGLDSNLHRGIQEIYELKKNCFKILQKYELFHKSVDQFYLKKNNLYKSLLNQVQPKVVEFRSKTSLYNGFQPYSEKFIKLEDQKEEAKIISSNQFTSNLDK